MTETQKLLREYVQSASETAFKELVERYLGLVYSAALRQTDYNAHQAEEVAQAVFTDLARQASQLPATVMLGGWLHQHTFFVASKLRREERRRQAREKQAAEMSQLDTPNEPEIAAIKGHLDDAITQLGTEDRAAISLRFFEQLDFHAVGAALGSSEDAARMRVHRALGRLRALLERRGIKATAAAVAATLSVQASEILPLGLAGKISATALSATVLPSAATLLSTKALVMTSLSKTVLSAGLAVAIGVGWYEAHQASQWRDQSQQTLAQIAAINRQMAQLEQQNQQLSAQLAQANQSPAVNTSRLRELLRLRGEVGVMRRRQRELEQALAAKAGPATAAVQNSASSTNFARPFRLQLVTPNASPESESLTNHDNGESVQVQKASLMDSTAIQQATVTKDPDSGASRIDLEFSAEGKELFAAITKENIGNRLAIVLDGQLYAAPVIRSEITGGKAQVTGNFTEEEARLIAEKINEMISAP